MEVRSAVRSGGVSGYLRALRGIVWRDIERAVRNYPGLIAAVAWPLLWLVVFAAGVQAVFGSLTLEAYAGAYKPYQEYVVPGLVVMALLFGSMAIAADFVAHRDIGAARLMLTAPLPRPYVLFCKIVGSAVVVTAHAYLFLAAASLLRGAVPATDVPWQGWLTALPAVFLCGLMLGALALLVAILLDRVREDTAILRFVLFPMLLLSSAFYPLWHFEETGMSYLAAIAGANPFTHAVELIRHAAYGGLNAGALAMVSGAGILAFAIAVLLFSPERPGGRR